MAMESDELRTKYQPMINLLTASRAEQTAVYVQIQLMIRQALDDEEAGRQPLVPSGDLVREYAPTLRILMADRPIQMDMVGAMELEIRQQRDHDLIGATGYAKAPKLPGHKSNTEVADARSRLNQEAPTWGERSALPVPDPKEDQQSNQVAPAPDPVVAAVRRRAA